MPIASCTVLVSNPNDSELKVQELILAELTCRRAYDAGSDMEKQGLRNENALLRTWLGREITRGDKLEQIDKNSQKMDTNSTIIQTTLEGRIADKNQELAEANDRLSSCQNNQKWIAGLSAVGGGFVGYSLGKGRLPFGSPGAANFPMPRPALPKIFQPRVPEYLR